MPFNYVNFARKSSHSFNYKFLLEMLLQHLATPYWNERFCVCIHWSRPWIYIDMIVIKAKCSKKRIGVICKIIIDLQGIISSRSVSFIQISIFAETDPIVKYILASQIKLKPYFIGIFWNLGKSTFSVWVMSVVTQYFHEVMVDPTMGADWSQMQRLQCTND